jgi:hypothetical protein
MSAMSNQPPSSPLPLEYLGAVQPVDLPPARQNLSFKIAIGCWLVPLLLGTSVFILWLVFRWHWLFAAGWGVIVVGTVSAGAGGICALILLCSRWSVSREPSREAVAPAVCLIFLLASNFVVAIILMMAVIRLANFHHGP